MDNVIPILAWAAALVVGIAIIVRLMRESSREKKSRAWPTAEAVVQSSDMEPVGKRRGSPLMQPCFAFSFEISGNYYSGRFSLEANDDQSTTLLREMIGRKVTVHYNPANPQDFVLREVLTEGCTMNALPD
jgi:hypothetical protein